jgi:3-hydroxyacyl-CoA dehydrogenase
MAEESSMKVDDIERIAIVGSGLMGHGIAQEFAVAGYEVQLNDLSEDRLEQAIHNIQSNLRMLMGFGLVTNEETNSALKNIHCNTLLRDAVAEVDLVIEAVFEDLALKQEIFRELDGACPGRAILASNTSSLMPSKLAAVTRRPEKVLVTHYFNPPYLLPLVEVVPCEDTADETVSTVCDLLTRVGKQPAMVKREVTGFIGNRLQVALVREALSIVEQGIATPQDVDIVIKSGFGRRLSVAGVFEVFDIAGWDLGITVASEILPEIESSQEIPRILQEKVDRGEFGVKTQKGFYEWTTDSAESLKQRIAQALIKIAQWS